MTFDEYQKGCRKTAIYPQETKKEGLEYTLIGLSGEVGELLNKFKKVLRGDGSISKFELDMGSELGDILWYVSETATQLGFKLDDVAIANLTKLTNRQINGSLKGSGDHR